MLSKKEVDYSPGMGRRRCKNCAHYEPPNACELVSGVIDPAYWCEKFKMAGRGKDWLSAQQRVNYV